MKMKDPNNIVTVVLMVLLLLSAMQAFQLSNIDNQITAAVSLNTYGAQPFYNYQAQYPQPVRYPVAEGKYWRR